MKKKRERDKEIYVTETVWPAKPKIFTPWPFWKRFKKFVYKRSFLHGVNKYELRRLSGFI